MELEYHPLAELFPLLHGDNYTALVADIRENGLREAIALYEGKILDGRNRYRACLDLGIEPGYWQYEGDQPLQYVISLNLHRRHLSESQRAMVAARIATLPAHRPGTAQICALTQPESAEMLNISRRSVQMAREVLEHGIPELIDATDEDLIPVSVSAMVARRSPDEQAEVVEQVRRDHTWNVLSILRNKDLDLERSKLKKIALEKPGGPFDVIVLDPPWPYGGDYHPQGRRAANPYPEMRLEEIAAIDLNALSSENSVLWLWTTHQFMRQAFPLLDVWGFTEKVILTWVKDRMGLGSWLRSQSEFCILAVRGHPTVQLTNQTSVLHAPMREHSRKPDEFYALVETLCLGQRRLDYFSREPREGWQQFGNDTRKFA